MRILLINPPHTSIGSRIPREQLPPLGLLSIGGPLIDAGFNVRLIDAEFGPLPLHEIEHGASDRRRALSLAEARAAARDDRLRRRASDVSLRRDPSRERRHRRDR